MTPRTDAQEVTGFGDPSKTLPQLSHGLTGRYRTMASVPDCEQNADLPIRIPAHRPDMLH
jgi:hypothetical protein